MLSTARARSIAHAQRCAAWTLTGLALCLLAAVLSPPTDAQTLRDDVFVTDNSVLATALSDDGATLYLGGNFTYVGPKNGSGARLDPADSSVLSDNLFVDGNIFATVDDGAGGFYIGGNFTEVGGVARNRLARILSNGTLDPTFNPSPDNTVSAMALSGSTLYVGGRFTTIGGQTRNRLAAVNVSNSQVTGFNPNANDSVEALAISGSTLYAGGFFTTIGGQARRFIAALNPLSGGALGSFNANASSSVYALALSGGTLYAGGGFTSIGGRTRRFIAALNAFNGQATGFNPNADRTVFALALSGSTLYAGGNFTTIGGQTRSRIAALDVTTGQATAFDPNASNVVRAMVLSGDTLYAGGQFSSIGGQTRNFLAALDVTTGQATAFDPNASSLVFALALSGDTLYAGGQFTSIGGQVRNRIAALDVANGLATGFNPNASNPVYALALSASTLYAGGFFSTIGGQARNRIAALDVATGQATAFDPNANNNVQTLALSGGTLYAGGNFTSIGGQARRFLAGLDTATGQATVFDPSPNGTVITSAVSGERLYAGGGFSSIGDVPRRGLAVFEFPTVVSSASEGWRMVSAPTSDLTVASLTDFNLVSGIPGDPQCDAAVDNLFTGYAGGSAPGTTAGYVLPGAYSDALASGRGFFWYFWDDPADAGPCGSGATASSVQPLPLALSTIGLSPTENATTTFTAADRAADDDTFYLAGNPFGEGLDLDGTAGGLVTVTAQDQNGPVAFQNTIQIWDPAAQGYVTRTAQADAGTDGAGGTSAADDLSVWQGVWLERSTAASPAYPLTVTYDAAYRTGNTSSDVFVGKQGSTESLRTLRFEISGTVGGTDVYDGAASVLFADGATAAWDAYDASKLGAFSSPFALLGPVGQDRDGALAPKAAESRPLDVSGADEIPLAFYTTGPGAFELSWPEVENVPAEWTLALTDIQTGQTTDLRGAEAYAFTSDATADWSERFTVSVSAPTVAGEDGPTAATLSQPMPNPSRSTTRLTLSVPSPERVRAAVYDALGREVAVLADGEVSGVLELRIDASRLAAGVYVVRVDGESVSETRRLTVIR